MSVRTLKGVHLSSRSVSGSHPTAGWVRPADWITMPAILETDQKFQGVYGVFETNDNYCCLMFTGDYHVDWGDGTSEDVASGVQASHAFDYAACGGPVCSLGYKTVLVTVTPQAGQNLVTMDLHRKHAYVPEVTYPGSWLDININAEHLTTVACPEVQVVTFYEFERLILGKNSCSSFMYLCFYY